MKAIAIFSNTGSRIVMSFMQKAILPIPIDPITTRAIEKAPRPVQRVVNPAGVIVRKTLGEDKGALLLDPLRLGEGNPYAERQRKALLAG